MIAERSAEGRRRKSSGRASMALRKALFSPVRLTRGLLTRVGPMYQVSSPLLTIWTQKLTASNIKRIRAIGQVAHFWVQARKRRTKSRRSQAEAHQVFN